MHWRGEGKGVPSSASFCSYVERERNFFVGVFFALVLYVTVSTRGVCMHILYVVINFLLVSVYLLFMYFITYNS